MFIIIFIIIVSTRLQSTIVSHLMPVYKNLYVRSARVFRTVYSW